MNNEEFFLEKTDTSVNARIELSEVHRPVLNKLKTLFKLTFNKERSVFKRLNDLHYYRGGYPKPESKPKLHDLLDDVGQMYQFYEFLDKSMYVNDYLRSNYGLMITTIHNSDLNAINESEGDIKKLKLLWNEMFDEELETIDNKAILKKLLEHGKRIQKTICEVADSVKVNDAEEVEQKCDVEKKIYLPVVNFKADYVRRGDEKVFEKIEKINKEHNELNDLLNKVLQEK